MEPDSAVEITVKDGGLLVHVHGHDRSPGECTVVVDAHNPTTETRRLAPLSLGILRAGADGPPLGAARFVRALVWSDTPLRRRFTPFAGDLAPGESVELRLFFAPEGALPEAVLGAKVALRYRVTFAREAGNVVLDSPPFHPQVVDD